MKKIVISGSTGLVGTRIVELLDKDFQFIHLLQDEIDITDKNAVWNFLKDLDFDIFLHLAAYTNVDGAEKDKELAYAINVRGTKNVFEATQQKNKKFVYISTGFVFDGLNPPYYEDSKPSPLGYYGKTKYEGEKVVLNHSMIVRIDTPYRASFAPKHDFVRKIKSLLEQKKELSMVDDALITPTFIDDLAQALKHLLANFSQEIYHIVGQDAVSPYKAGKLITKTFGLESSLIKPIGFEKFLAGRAKRPKYLDMKSKKNNFYKMKTFEEGLLEIKRQIG